MAVIPMLTPNNAVLTTATITIATLRLDKRQVTQAMFRQVPERSPIGADGGLIEGAVPWGLVSYWWPDASRPQPAESRYNSIHLLWQYRHQLHRARLWAPLWVFGSEHASEFVPFTCICAGRACGFDFGGTCRTYNERTFPCSPNWSSCTSRRSPMIDPE